MIRHRQLLGDITLFLDFTVASRNPSNTTFAALNVDRVLLTNNHSKTMYMRSGTNEMLAVMSNNATNNQRYESGTIFKNHPAIKIYKTQLEAMKQHSAPWMI